MDQIVDRSLDRHDSVPLRVVPFRRDRAAGARAGRPDDRHRRRRCWRSSRPPSSSSRPLFGLLSVGGVLGVVGYARARIGVRNLDRHNVSATLLCLAGGIVTALAVAGYAVFGTLVGLRSPWSSPGWVSLTTLFAAANVVWAVSGIAWMQRLPRRYAERTGGRSTACRVLLFVIAAQRWR